MYANSYGQSNPPSGLSNNPFVEDPTTAHARFPDLASNGYPNHSQQYPPQYHPSYGAGGLYQAQTQPMLAQSQFTPTYAPQYLAQAQTGPQPTSVGAFQPANGYPQPQQQQQQYPISPAGYAMSYSGTGYPAHAQTTMSMQTTATPNYLAEFDPFAHQRTTPSQNQNQSQIAHHAHGATSSGGPGVVPHGVSHPRDVIRVYKSGLEAWDAYSWKQLLGACDALKEAWSARKQQAESVIRQYGGHSDPGLFGPDPAFGYNSQVEGWKQVLKSAHDNIDTVTASTFQLHEVFNSYRQSGDQASKRRVRESCNAAVNGLPDWPSN